MAQLHSFLKLIVRPIDILLSIFSIIGFLTVFFAIKLFGSRQNKRNRRMLVIQTFHSYEYILNSGHEEMIHQSDLGGFFQKVDTLYPILGANPTDRAVLATPYRHIEMNPCHHFMEYKMSRFGFKYLPFFDFVFSQIMLLLNMREHILKNGIGLIKAHCPFLTGLYAFILSQWTKVPYSLRIGGNYDLMYQNGLMVYKKIFRKYWVEKCIAKLVLSHAHNISAVNENNLEYCVDNGAPREQCVVTRYGNMIDPIHYTDPQKRETYDNPEKLDLSRPIAIYVGRLNPVKHPEDLLDFVKHVTTNTPDILLLIIGSGECLESMKLQAAELGIEGNIGFLGHQDQSALASLYPLARMYVSTLTGRSLVEAALAALPMIAYDYEWHKEIVINDKTGLLVPYRDTKALAHAASTLLERPQYASELGNNARELALDMMDKTKIQNIEIEIAKTLLAE